MLWVICGAGRFVGKTMVAHKLCRVLDESIYVKCGHGEANPAKPKNFCRTLDELSQFIDAVSNINPHIVIESNAYAKTGKADIVIFLDGAAPFANQTCFRADREALCELADLTVTIDDGFENWLEVLSKKTHGLALETEVLREISWILDEQRQFLFE